MKIPCPHCGAVIDTKAAKDPLQALNGLYKRFNDAEALVREYVRLFVPASGIMTQPRERRLVEGLLKVWETGYFERNQRGWEIGKDAVAEALRYICNNKSGLTGEHGYLLTVLKAKAVEADRKAEAEKEYRARNTSRRSEPAPVTAALPEITEADREAAKATIREARQKLFGKKGGR